ncbi:hypothetical protein GGX14DRAFT_574864 [Mycena pura]|uniref:Uncharacterized protein n=1 Tax=Mycena pura TaxID=153505 RepID=A0AAD6V0P4_9AGAR|nr:hypothetical protein GGX14DRAFT_574864 [Mycena pura]
MDVDGPSPPPRSANTRVAQSRILQALPNGLLTPPATQGQQPTRNVTTGGRGSNADNAGTYKSKVIVFDAQIYLGSSEPAFITSLCYFNTDNVEFADVGSYLVVIHAARSSPTIEVYSQELTALDYHAFGDIVWIVPLGSPENFDMRHHAVAAVHVAGVATNVNRDDSTFEIHRWEKYKPVPTKGKSVLIEGLLTGLKRNEDRTIKHFIIDLEKVSFLIPAAPKAEESPTKLVPNQGTPACLKFTGFLGNQESDPKSEEPNRKKRSR